MRSFQADNRHDGISQADLSPPLQEEWRRRLPGVVGYPVLAEGSVYVPSGGQVTAFDLATGHRDWLRVLSGEELVGLAYGAGHVFAMTGDCTLLALGPEDGSTDWTRKIWSAGGCAAPPVVANGSVFIQQAQTGHRLIAIDAATGQTRWSRPIGTAGYTPPIATKNRIIVTGIVDVRVYRYDGTLVWRNDCCGNNGPGGTPALYDGLLYTRHGGGVVLDASTGEPVGMVDSEAPMAFSGDTALRVLDGNLEAVDLVGGEPRWVFDPASPIARPPLVIGTHALIHAVDGTLSAIRISDGTVTWETQAPPSYPGNDGCGCFIGSAATGNHYVLPADNTLVVYSAAE